MSQDPRHRMPKGDRSRRREAARRATRRSATLTFATTVFPGLGLLGTRYRRLGALIVVLVVLATILAVAAVMMVGPTNAALAVAVRPNVLLAVAAALIFGGLIWVWSIVLAHRGTTDPLMSNRQRAGLRTFTALLCMMVILPVGTAASYSLIQRDVVGTMFSAPIGTNDSPELDVRPGKGPDPWAGVTRVNMLLLGSDAGDDRIGTRTDSMIVASMNPQTGETVLFSLPRNLENVPFPKTNPLYKQYPRGYNCGPPDCLLNGVWSLAEANKKLFVGDPTPGLTTIRGVIQEITGLRMHYTTVIDLKGFEALVDAMGGVVVTVRDKLPIGGHLNAAGNLVGVDSWLKPGTQRLDGFSALWFARSRLASDDYDRMRRQRCLVGKILDQVNPVSMLQQYPALARAARDNITTDVPADELPAWMTLVQRIKDASIQSLPFTSQIITPSNPDFRLIRAMIREAISPELSTATATGPTTSKTTKTTPSTSTKSSTTKSSTSTKTSTKSSSTSRTSDQLVDLEDAC